MENNQQPPRPPHPPFGQGQTPPPPPPPGYMPMYQQQAPRSAGNWSMMSVMRRVFVGIMSTVLLFSIFLNIYMGIFFASTMSGPMESYYAGTDQNNRIVILPIQGAIDSETAAYVNKTLRSLQNNPPEALILRINSPGGGVSPSDQIWNGIMQFKKQTNIPVVSSFGGVAASGGYYIASASDYIVSEPTCITGSIGVIAQAFTLDRMMDKIGVTPETVVSTDSTQKDALNSFRPWTDSDRDELREILDTAYERFIKIVDDARPDLDLEQVRKLATGAPYTTKQALENKLVDEEGYVGNAIAKAINLAGLPAGSDPKVTVIQQHNPFGFLGASGKQSNTDLSTLLNSEKIRSMTGELAMPQLQYRMEMR
ncbi:MAG: signal peptide peptidase SppA [Phycisphaeraceae bacterium]|nr:signal peptide peptidase SppA [Phycisphaeraceae bacterium]